MFLVRVPLKPINHPGSISTRRVWIKQNTDLFNGWPPIFSPRCVPCEEWAAHPKQELINSDRCAYFTPHRSIPYQVILRPPPTLCTRSIYQMVNRRQKRGSQNTWQETRIHTLRLTKTMKTISQLVHIYYWSIRSLAQLVFLAAFLVLNLFGFYFVLISSHPPQDNTLNGSLRDSSGVFIRKLLIHFTSVMYRRVGMCDVSLRGFEWRRPLILMPSSLIYLHFDHVHSHYWKSGTIRVLLQREGNFQQWMSGWKQCPCLSTSLTKLLTDWPTNPFRWFKEFGEVVSFAVIT